MQRTVITHVVNEKKEKKPTFSLTPKDYSIDFMWNETEKTWRPKILDDGAYSIITSGKYQDQKIAINVAIKQSNPASTYPYKEVLDTFNVEESAYQKFEEARRANPDNAGAFNSLLRCYGSHHYASFGLSRINLVLELAECNLSDLREEKNFTWEMCYKVLGEVAKGLNIMHTLNPPLIHRDIKPANILVDTNMCGKISDFGYVTDEANMEPMAGTPHYLEPQSYCTLEKSTKIDSWAFGVMLSEMFNRKGPYANEGIKTRFDLMEFVLGKGISAISDPDPRSVAVQKEFNLMETYVKLRTQDVAVAKKLNDSEKVIAAEEQLKETQSKLATIEAELDYTKKTAEKARALTRWCCMYPREDRPTAADLVKAFDKKSTEIESYQPPLATI